MARVAKVTPLLGFADGVLTKAAEATLDQRAEAIVPSTVTGAWESLNLALGIIVPGNVNRAKHLSGHFLNLVR